MLPDCRDCRFSWRGYCGHEASTGATRHPRYTCGFERRSLSGCGKSGRWFEEWRRRA